VQTAGLPRDAEEEEEQRRILRQADELARALGVSSARAMYVGLGEGRHVRSLVITFEDAERIAKRLGGL
jgi:hypothetical protein